MPWITPQRLTPIAHSQSRWVADSSPPQSATPALLHSTWTAPISANARSASAWTCSSRLTSVLTAMAALPARATSATVSAIPASSRSATTTRAPSRAKARASARPIPLAAAGDDGDLAVQALHRVSRVAWCVLTETPRVSRRREEMSSVSASRRWYSLGGDVGGPSPTFHPSEPDAMTELDHVDYRLPTTVVPSRYDLRLEPDLDECDVQRRGNRHRRGPGARHGDRAQRGGARIESAAMEDASGAVVEGSVRARRARRARPHPVPRAHRAGTWRLRLRFTGILNDRLHGFYRSSYKDAARGRPHDCRHPVRGDGRPAGVSVLGRAGGESRLRRDARRPRGPRRHFQHGRGERVARGPRAPGRDLRGQHPHVHVPRGLRRRRARGDAPGHGGQDPTPHLVRARQDPPGARWPSRSARSPSSSSSSTTACRIPATSSTSSPFPTSRRGRWRTWAPSPSARRRSWWTRRRPRTPSSSAWPTSSPTRWPTCGSATSSPCSGGTASGSTRRSPRSWSCSPSMRGSPSGSAG